MAKKEKAEENKQAAGATTTAPITTPPPDPPVDPQAIIAQMLAGAEAQIAAMVKDAEVKAAQIIEDAKAKAEATMPPVNTSEEAPAPGTRRSKERGKAFELVDIYLTRDEFKKNAPLYVAVGKRSFLIERGKKITVPRFIAEVIAESEAQDNRTLEMISHLERKALNEAAALGITQ